MQAPPKVQSVPTKPASTPAVTENVKEHRYVSLMLLALELDVVVPLNQPSNTA